MRLVAGPVLPQNGSGDPLVAFAVVSPAEDGVTYYVLPSVIINAAGDEIGSQMLSALDRIADNLDTLIERSELAGLLV